MNIIALRLVCMGYRSEQRRGRLHTLIPTIHGIYFCASTSGVMKLGSNAIILV
jgi:hypothetical protein